MESSGFLDGILLFKSLVILRPNSMCVCVCVCIVFFVCLSVCMYVQDTSNMYHGTFVDVPRYICGFLIRL
jgi:amino acid permease